MATVFFIHPPNGPSPNPRERRGKDLEVQPWGTPTAEELERLLDTVQQSVERPLVHRSEAIGLLIQCHMMLLRCHGALTPMVPAGRKVR